MSSVNYTDRLNQVRSSLKDMGCSGFVIPKTDPHQNEYLPPRFERLAWLTNFHGSAGIAIVLEDTAALFVDGRYTLEAKDSINAKNFDVLPYTWSDIKDWLSKNLMDQSTLGYDGTVLLTHQISHLQDVAKDKSASLLPLTTNPIDTLKDPKNSPKISKIVHHPVKYSGQPANEKIASLTKTLTEKNCDFIIMNDLPSIAWLLNIRGEDVPYTPLVLANLIVHKSGKCALFTDAASDFDHLKHLTLHAYDQLYAYLSAPDFQNKRILVDERILPIAVLNALKAVKANLINHPDPTTLPRSIKNPTEVKGMRACHVRDGVALCEFFAWLDSEVFNLDVSELMCSEKIHEYRKAQEHFKHPSFETISGAAEHGAIVHYRVSPLSNKKLERGHIYLIDSGGQYLDGTTDVTRTICVGHQPTQEQKHKFTQVLKGHINLASAVFPKGTSGPQLDILARQELWNEGYDFAHGTGHGVGSYLNVHEGPQGISPRAASVPLEPGMIISNEPGYYEDGHFGIRIENLVEVIEVEVESKRSDFLGFNTLTLCPLDQSLIDKDLLSHADVKWINDYHDRVYETLSPLLSDKASEWLKGATMTLIKDNAKK